MIDFFNSNMFIGLATIFTGGVAILVYFIQRRNSKIQAAKVLLSEIRIAEDKLEQIRDKILDNNTMDLPSIFPSQSWHKYSYLFVSDFDIDDLKMINSFYDFGETLEEFAMRNNNYFWITTEERAKLTVRKVAQYIDESSSQQNPGQYVTSKRDIFNLGMDSFNQPYAPKKTLDGIRNNLSKIQKITTSSCGEKLKKIANRR